MTDSRFWDRIADRYAARPIDDLETYTEKLRRTQAMLRPQMRILEVGCGTGSTALAHAPHVAHVHATDLSPRMIAIARARAAEAGIPNVTFDVASAEEIEAPAGGYDAVLALNLLHLVADRPAVLRRLGALVKPGGLLVASTPCLADGMAWVGWVAPAARALGLWPRVSVFSAAAFEREMQQAGFDIETRWQPKARAARFHIARSRSIGLAAA